MFRSTMNHRTQMNANNNASLGVCVCVNAALALGFRVFNFSYLY